VIKATIKALGTILGGVGGSYLYDLLPHIH
jgi:hypothetical protein